MAAKSRELAEVQRGIYDRQAEIRRISEDQARVRENLKALKGSDAEKALTERYTRQLSARRIASTRSAGSWPTRTGTAPRSSRSCRGW